MIQNRQTADPVLASLNYHIAGEANPQIVIDADGIPGNRIDPELDRRTVELHDVRAQEKCPTFRYSGFEFARSLTEVSSFGKEDFDRTAYDRELISLIRKTTGASEVEIFDHTIRTDGDGTRRPARHVHGDYNAESARMRLYDILGSELASEWEQGKFGLVNVWRPLYHPVERAPLAFAVPESVAASDWTDIDIVYPDRVGQISGLKHNPGHRWVFLPDMTPDDVVVFNVFDSAGLPAVAHSAADLVVLPGNARVRKSIESRSLVRFS